MVAYLLQNCPRSSKHHCCAGAISLRIDDRKLQGIGFKFLSTRASPVSRRTPSCACERAMYHTKRGLPLCIVGSPHRSAAAWGVLLPLFPPRPPLGRLLVKRHCAHQRGVNTVFLAHYSPIHLSQESITMLGPFVKGAILLRKDSIDGPVMARGYVEMFQGVRGAPKSCRASGKNG